MSAQEIWNTTLLNDANLMGYHRMESGLFIHDSSNHGRSILQVGSPAEADGMFGKCVDLGVTNTTKYFYRDNDAYGVVNQGTFSISCWAKLMQAQTDEEQDVLFSFTNNGYGAFFLRLYKPTGSATQINLVRNNGLSQEQDDLTSDPGTSNWHHYAVVVNGTSMKFYYDGSDQGSTACSGTQNGSVTSLTIGGNYGGVSLFDGLIDEFLFFNDVLTGTEITNIYSGGLTSYVHPSSGFFAHA